MHVSTQMNLENIMPPKRPVTQDQVIHASVDVSSPARQSHRKQTRVYAWLGGKGSLGGVRSNPSGAHLAQGKRLTPTTRRILKATEWYIL